MKSKKGTPSAEEYKKKEAQRTGNRIFGEMISEISRSNPDLYWRFRPGEDQDDKGIDYEHELEDRPTGDSLLIFKTQNKGTDNKVKRLVSTANKGFISFPIQVRHVWYYRRQINIGLLLIVVENNSKSIFWHSVQLDDGLDDLAAAAEKEGKKSITLYIDPCNQLTVTNFARFMSDLKSSTQVQQYRHQQFLRHPVLDSGQPVIDRSKHLLDQVYDLIQILFKEVRFYPVDLLIKNYPLKKQATYFCYYHTFNLETDHEELVELFQAGDVAEDGTVIFNDPAKVSGVTDAAIKFQTVYEQLFGNYIYVIRTRRKEVALKATHSKVCDCCMCRYRRFDISGAIAALKEPASNVREKLKMGYLSYQLRNMLDAAKFFLDAYEDALKEKSGISAVICVFNLMKLKKFIKEHYWEGNEHTDILEKIKKLDLKQTVERFKNPENQALLNWITENKFFTNAAEEGLNVAHKIRNHYYSQLSGGRQSNQQARDMISIYAELDTFLFGNYIIYDEFLEFEDVTILFVDAMYLSYAMNSEQPGRLIHFNDWLIHRLLFNAKPETLRERFSFYHLKEIDYQQLDGSTSFVQMLGNLFTLNQQLPADFKNYSDGRIQDFTRKYHRYQNNALVLAAQLKLSDADVNQIMKWVIEFLDGDQHLGFDGITALQYLIDRKSAQIEAAFFSKLLEMTVTIPDLRSEDLIYLLTGCIEKFNVRFTLPKPLFKQLYADTFQPEDQQRQSRENVITYYYKFLSTTEQRKVKAAIEKSLQKQFVIQDYYMAAIMDILPFAGDFYEQFKQLAVPKFPDPRVSGLFGQNQNRSTYTDMFINLCFKKGFDLSNGEFDVLRGANNYYDWLTNLSGFNYELFEPAWLKVYRTKYYFEQFKKQRMIRLKLAAYLKTNYDISLERIFFTLYDE
ncbi:DUF4365 domain-containing protein [Mucilaginibacter sabulilitoris]|uniref:DUF4365 domain-containing protein n=1 Tax=Mucilaginibacter sabulilitoris TaxID=1173583 RepID=A0ABZ0TVB5_9SPHI|nr:DUF4365 domain-containing protein [Mucilaginibacter sabulilitoris]WPU96412.1 DUF4365 domain-containing protein [Mucilaginibacter sabulilitoris]